MMIATAARSASIAFDTPNYYESFAFADNVLGKGTELPKSWALSLKNVSLIVSKLQSPVALPATWLAIVQKRIQHSIIPQDQENDGRYLSKDIAEAAKKFFEQTSDMLPSEPHIYSSSRGDLVAEFQTESGNMTGVVSQDLAMLFAVVDGVLFEAYFPLGKSKDATRRELQHFLARLHGSVVA